MNQPLTSDELIERYLLGMATEDECEQLERLYLADGTEFERLSAAEDELVEDYLDGNLNPQQRRAFETYFMASGDRQEELAFARDLRTAAHHAREVERGKAGPIWLRWRKAFEAYRLQWAGIALLAVAVVGIGLLWQQNRYFTRRVGVAQTETKENEAVRKQSAAAAQGSSSIRSASAADLAVVTAMLAPGLIRSEGGLAAIPIPRNTQLAIFQLELITTDYHSYRASLSLMDGPELVSESQLQPSNRHEIRVPVPADLLRSGDYQIRLDGETPKGRYEPAATYSFRIAR